MYHLGDDSAESRDRVAEQPQVVERLTKLLDKYKADGRSRPAGR